MRKGSDLGQGPKGTPTSQGWTKENESDRDTLPQKSRQHLQNWMSERRQVALESEN